MFDLGNAEKNQLLDEHAENKYWAEGYEIDINDKNNTKIIIKDYIKDGATCLDVGCGAGYLGQILKKHKKAKMYGVDVDADALEVARKTKCFEEVYEFSITERSGEDYEKFIKEDGKFDYIMFTDVLEHVVNADEMLRFFSKYLKPKGELLVSLPNVAHFDIVRGLVNRKFNYSHIGLLDNTHLRFYTKSSFVELIEQINEVYDENFAIKEIGKTVIEPGYITQYPKIYELLNQDGESCVLQYVYAISMNGRSNADDLVVNMQTFDELEARLNEVDRLRARVGELEVAIDGIYKSKSWVMMRPVRGASRVRKKIKNAVNERKTIDLKRNVQQLVKFLRLNGVRVAVIASQGGATKETAEELVRQGCLNVLISTEAGMAAPIFKERGFKVVAMVDDLDMSDENKVEGARNANFYADYLIFETEETKKAFQEKFDATMTKTKVLPWELTWKTVREIAKCFKENGWKMADLTAVIPNYNYEKYLPMRIMSILEQTVKPREIILLDDNSTDNSLIVAEPILKRAQEKYGIEYRIIKNEENIGCFRQWCRGFEEAKYPLVWTAEADDWERPNFVETVLPSFEDKKVVLSYCKSCRMNGDSIVDNYDFNWYIEELDKEKWTKDFVDGDKEFVKKYLSDRNSIPNASAVIIRKSATRGIEKELTKYQAIGDWFAYIYIVSQGKIHYHADVLNGFRRHDESIIAKKEQSPVFLKEKKMIMKYLAENFK